MKDVRDSRNELLCHTRSEETCLNISCEVYGEKVAEVFDCVSHLARPIFAKNISFLQDFLTGQRDRAGDKLKESLMYLQQKQFKLWNEFSSFDPSKVPEFNQVYIEQHKSWLKLQKTLRAGTADADRESLEGFLIPRQQVHFISERLVSQCAVRRFFAAEKNNLPEQKRRLSAELKDKLDEAEDKMRRFLKAMDGVISATTELLLIAEVSRDYNMPANSVVDARHASTKTLYDWMCGNKLDPLC